MPYVHKRTPTTQRILDALQKGDFGTMALAEKLYLTEWPIWRAVMALLADEKIHVCGHVLIGRATKGSRVFRLGGPQ